MNKSNNTYTLKEFFLGRTNKDENDYRKIIIPDMQREYCWPSETNTVDGKDLVSSFVTTLIEMSVKNSPVKMGLLYGYESPQYNIQLCDGQQRLTTLYLVIGSLRRMICKENANQTSETIKCARNILISDFEDKEDDKDPRFQYAIRESTLFFLRDLVMCHFLGDTEVDSIIHSEWYFDEYTQDPSIVNIIKALTKIYEQLKKLTSLEAENLLDYIINQLSFLYFDMRDRSHGEEQFVVINTTGKALTFSENLKPVLLGRLTEKEYKDGKSELQYFSDLWENWEHFFWTKRNDKECCDFVADGQLKEFFRWVYIIEMSLRDTKPAATEKEKYIPAQKAYNSHFNLLDITSNIPELLELIEGYMSAYIKIINDCLWIKNEKTPLPFTEVLSQMDCFRFIPVLYFVKQFKCSSSDRRHILRVQRLMWELSEHSNYSVDMAIVEIIRSIKQISVKHSESKDIALIVKDDVYKSIRKALLPSDTIIKLRTFISVTSEERDEYENVIWEIENMACCKGDISFFYNELIEDSNNNLPLEAYRKIRDLLKATANRPNALFRRSLLTYGDYHEHLSFSRRLELYTYSFAKDAVFFRSAFREQKSEVIHNIVIRFLKDAYNSSLLIEEYMNQKIEDYMSVEHRIPDNDYWKLLIHLLITDSALFEYAQRGVVCYNDNKVGQPIARIFEYEKLYEGGERSIKQLGTFQKTL